MPSSSSGGFRPGFDARMLPLETRIRINRRQDNELRLTAYSRQRGSTAPGGAGSSSSTAGGLERSQRWEVDWLPWAGASVCCPPSPDCRALDAAGSLRASWLAAARSGMSTCAWHDQPPRPSWHAAPLPRLPPPRHTPPIATSHTGAWWIPNTHHPSCSGMSTHAWHSDLDDEDIQTAYLKHRAAQAQLLAQKAVAAAAAQQKEAAAWLMVRHLQNEREGGGGRAAVAAGQHQVTPGRRGRRPQQPGTDTTALQHLPSVHICPATPAARPTCSCHQPSSCARTANSQSPLPALPPAAGGPRTRRLGGTRGCCAQARAGGRTRNPTCLAAGDPRSHAGHSCSIRVRRRRLTGSVLGCAVERWGAGGAGQGGACRAARLARGWDACCIRQLQARPPAA
jgi:hypothetical protein